MGQQSVGGMWCDYCGQRVPAERTTHRTRNTIAGIGALATGGASLFLAKVEGAACSNCGGPVRPATEDDYYYYRAQLAAVSAERAAQEPEPKSSDDWRELPAHHVPPWREKDRMRLDALRAGERPSQATEPGNLAAQLAKVAELHGAGALTAEEFAEAKQRILRESS